MPKERALRPLRCRAMHRFRVVVLLALTLAVTATVGAWPQPGSPRLPKRLPRELPRLDRLPAGTLGLTRGDGYLWASLKGPKAEVVETILRRSVRHADLAQTDIQVLLWSILARGPVGTLDAGPRRAAEVLLNDAQLASIDSSALDNSYVNMQVQLYSHERFEARRDGPGRIVALRDVPGNALRVDDRGTEIVRSGVHARRWARARTLTGRRGRGGSRGRGRRADREPHRRPDCIERIVRAARWAGRGGGPARRRVGGSGRRCLSDAGLGERGRRLAAERDAGVRHANRSARRRLGWRRNGGRRPAAPRHVDAHVRRRQLDRRGAQCRRQVRERNNALSIATDAGGFLGMGIPDALFGQILDFNFDTWGQAAESLAGDPPRDDFKEFTQLSVPDLPKITVGRDVTADVAARIDSMTASLVTAKEAPASEARTRLIEGIRELGNHFASLPPVGKILEVRIQNAELRMRTRNPSNG